MAEIYISRAGAGSPLVLLPPAPHSGAFFEPLLPALSGVETLSVDYPGYGQSASGVSDFAPSIQTYAEAIAPHLPKRPSLLGFHTGTLVAVEIAKHIDVNTVILIDIPAFDAETRSALATKFSEPSPERNNAAFLAAFAYDVEAEFPALKVHTDVIATQSSLLELTRKAATWLPSATLHERLNVTAPAFETHAATLAETILTLVNGTAGGTLKTPT